MISIDDKTPPAAALEQLNHSNASHWFRIRVNDNGCGMTAEQTEHCLDPFFTTKPVGEGTGLGLSESFGLIAKAGGILKVNSAENLGTQIDIYLPATSPLENT